MPPPATTATSAKRTIFFDELKIVSTYFIIAPSDVYFLWITSTHHLFSNTEPFLERNIFRARVFRDRAFCKYMNYGSSASIYGGRASIVGQIGEREFSFVRKSGFDKGKIVFWINFVRFQERARPALQDENNRIYGGRWLELPARHPKGNVRLHKRLYRER